MFSSTLWIVVELLALWFVIRVTGWDRWVPMAQGVAFTPYVALFVPVPLVAAALTHRWVLTAASLALAIGYASLIAPRFFHNRRQQLIDGDGFERAQGRLRVLSLNVFVGSAEVGALIRLLDTLRPDLICIQENTVQWISEFNAALLTSELRDEYPYAHVRDKLVHRGTALYSRYPLVQERSANELFYCDMARAVLELPGGAIDVVSIHLAPPTPEARRDYYRDFYLLPGLVAKHPRLWAGDFNATVDHSVFRRLLKEAQLVSAARVAGKALTPTWQDFSLPPVAIDHVLTEAEARVARFEVHRVPGTDHRAVFTELHYE